MADTIYEALIEFKEVGLMAVNLEMESLVNFTRDVEQMAKNAASAMSRFGRMAVSAVQAPQKMFTALGRQLTALSNNPILRGARTGALAVSAGIAGMFAGAAAGTEELSAFSEAFKVLAQTIGAGFAPYVRMATQAVVELTSYIKEAGSNLTDSIAKWSLITAAIAGVVAIAPTVLGFLGGLATAIGALMSPLGLVVAGAVAVIAAFNAMFGAGVEAAQQGADGINAANKGWVDKTFEFFRSIGTAAAQLWNWIVQTAAAAVNKIVKFYYDMETGIAAIWAEITGKTTDEIANIGDQANKKMRELAGNPFKFDAIQIDVKKVGDAFDGVQNKFKGVFADAAALWDRLKGGVADDGFSRKSESKMIGFADSWKGLQLAAANDPSQELMRQQLQAVQDIAKWTPMIVAAVDGLKGKLWGGK